MCKILTSYDVSNIVTYKTHSIYLANSARGAKAQACYLVIELLVAAVSKRLVRLRRNLNGLFKMLVSLISLSLVNYDVMFNFSVTKKNI